MGNLGKKVSQTNSNTQVLDPFLCHKNKKESFQTPVPRTQASNPINRLKMTAVFKSLHCTGRKTSDPTCMFHSEMTSLYLGKVDVGVSAGSLVTKYGGLSNCERSIFVRSTVEEGHTFQHHWSSHWLAGDQNRTTFFFFYFCYVLYLHSCAESRWVGGSFRRLGRRNILIPYVWTSESLR